MSLKVRVTEPRHGAVEARRQRRALANEQRCGWTLKITSGMTSTRWRTAAHVATGRLCSRLARRSAWARPRQSGVLNKSLGIDRSPSKPPGFAKAGSAKLRRKREDRSHLARQASSPKPLQGEQIPGERAGGPNSAHPVTQNVSNPYLRLESLDGKHVAETPHKPQACGRPLSSD